MDTATSGNLSIAEGDISMDASNNITFLSTQTDNTMSQRLAPSVIVDTLSPSLPDINVSQSIAHSSGISIDASNNIIPASDTANILSPKNKLSVTKTSSQTSELSVVASNSLIQTPESPGNSSPKKKKKSKKEKKDRADRNIMKKKDSNGEIEYGSTLPNHDGTVGGILKLFNPIFLIPTKAYHKRGRTISFNMIYEAVSNGLIKLPDVYAEQYAAAFNILYTKHKFAGTLSVKWLKN